MLGVYEAVGSRLRLALEIAFSRKELPGPMSCPLPQAASIQRWLDWEVVSCNTKMRLPCLGGGDSEDQQRPLWLHRTAVQLLPLPFSFLHILQGKQSGKTIKLWTLATFCGNGWLKKWNYKPQRVCLKPSKLTSLPGWVIGPEDTVQ